MGRIGFGELVVILIIALLVFGPSKLPEMGKAVGNAMREFRMLPRELQMIHQQTFLTKNKHTMPDR